MRGLPLRCVAHPLRTDEVFQQIVLADMANGHSILRIAEDHALAWNTVAAFQTVLVHGDDEDFAAWCEGRLTVAQMLKVMREVAEG